MSIYSKVESGTSFHRSRFTRSISNRMDYDCQFHQLVPVLKRFVLPGDIWRIGGDVLVRFQPLRTPTLTPNNFRVRYFFVPLRLVEPNSELIITGSKDGHLYAPDPDDPSKELPIFENFVSHANKLLDSNAYKVLKHTFWDYMNVQTGDYEAIKTDECLPALYWWKAYARVAWDYYFDENLSYQRTTFNDFNDFLYNVDYRGANFECLYSCLNKDYFTSSLPWQLKGTAPRIDVTGTATFTPNYSGDWVYEASSAGSYPLYANLTAGNEPFVVNNSDASAFNTKFNNQLNQQQSLSISQLGFTADDLRTMMAQTRIFERLARTGSRYTEYLRANFGVAPADDTLQRAQYLGGWKIPIVTTEVLQTAEATAYGSSDKTPIGTMRGHGITRGGNRINTFYAKEFGILLGLAEVRPDVQYTTGIPRQLTYKRRWDFFNPSFQHLSEQEVRKGELFISNSDGENDNTFGFQAYGNELRSAQNETVGDLRDSLSDWNQALHFSSRPELNNAFIAGKSHRASFNAPFVVQSADSFPIIVQFYNNLDVYRPMVRYATPGLVDHL